MAAMLVGSGIIGYNSERGLPKVPSILPSLVPIGPVVSEENIKILKVNDGRPVVANAHLTLWVRRVKKLLRK